MPARVMISGSNLIDIDANNFYTFSINPIEFDSQDSTEVKYGRTIGGDSFEFIPQYDGRPRSFEWKNLPNRGSYITLISNLESLVGQNTYLKLRDLTGTLNNETETYIRVTNLTKVMTRGGQTDVAYIKWATVRLEYVEI